MKAFVYKKYPGSLHYANRECRNCHDRDSMAQQTQTVSAGVMHGQAESWGKTCIDCHTGVVHALPRDFDKYASMDELHERMERDDIDCKLCHEAIAAPPDGEEW